VPSFPFSFANHSLIVLSALSRVLTHEAVLRRTRCLLPRGSLRPQSRRLLHRQEVRVLPLQFHQLLMFAPACPHASACFSLPSILQHFGALNAALQFASGPSSPLYCHCIFATATSLSLLPPFRGCMQLCDCACSDTPLCHTGTSLRPRARPSRGPFASSSPTCGAFTDFHASRP